MASALARPHRQLSTRLPDPLSDGESLITQTDESDVLMSNLQACPGRDT
jgi:hypothetical protein